MTSSLTLTATSAVVEPRKRVATAMLEAARLAPSAENAQPWRFAVDEDTLVVGVCPSQRMPSDVADLLFWTGSGAAIENAVIAARSEGYEPEVQLLPFDGRRMSGDVQPIAQIIPAGSAPHDDLARFIPVRATSRRLESRPVSAESLAALSRSVKPFPDVQLDWVVEPAALKLAGQLVGQGNRLRFEHASYQREFYEYLRFTPAEVRETRDGLDVRTLQLPWTARAALRVLRPWRRMRAANLLGFSRAVARQAAREVQSSGAVGLLSIPQPEISGMIDAGRAFQRLWLTATAEGLGLHPTASLPVLLAHDQRRGEHALPAPARRRIALAGEDFRRGFPALRDRTLQMAFRIGFGPAGPVRSLRRNASELLLDVPGAVRE